MAKKAAKSKTRRHARGAADILSIPVKVDTHPLFGEAEKLRAFAQAVIEKLDGTTKERAGLKKMIGTIDDIQALIKQACNDIDGGNPMYNNFNIKVPR